MNDSPSRCPAQVRTQELLNELAEVIAKEFCCDLGFPEGRDYEQKMRALAVATGRLFRSPNGIAKREEASGFRGAHSERSRTCS